MSTKSKKNAKNISQLLKNNFITIKLAKKCKGCKIKSIPLNSA